MPPLNLVRLRSAAVFSACLLIGAALISVAAFRTAHAAPPPPDQPVAPAQITATALPSPSPTPSPTVTFTPSATFTPTVTLTPSPTFTPSIAPTLITTLVPGLLKPESADWTPPPPGPDQRAGNFIFGRPFAPPANTYWSRDYAYGSTKQGQLQIHHGVDTANPTGTAILAAAEGTVFYAGPDVAMVFGPRPDFYGIVVVLEHPFMYSDGTKIYSLYGHMSQTVVTPGQTVKAGEIIGYVGATGVALGPHLHFEVRVGDPRSYLSTRNPELWIAPYDNHGVVAGWVRDIYGNLLEGVRVELQAPGANDYGFSYVGTGVNPDANLRENYVIPDVPAGYYYVVVKDRTETLFRKAIYVWPGAITWVEIHLIRAPQP